MTRSFTPPVRRRLALNVTVAIMISCLALYLFGNFLFAVIGITVDAFRIGSGALLFMSAVSLVRGQEFQVAASDKTDIAWVPLAIPITIGPATTGALLIMGAEVQSVGLRIVGGVALCLAGLSVGLGLFMAPLLERWLGERGLSILSRLTGLFLSAMAAQMIFTGIKSFLVK